MIPPWIIEKIKHQEEEKRRREQRPQLQLEEPEHFPLPPREKNPERPDNGTIIIEPPKQGSVVGIEILYV